MPLITTAIVAVCVNYQGAYVEACNKALDATTRQVGLRYGADLLESKANEVVTQKAEMVIGKRGMEVVGSGTYVYKVIADKSVRFRVPTLGLCNSITNRITPISYDLTAEWKF